MHRTDLLTIFHAALRAADPERAVAAALSLTGTTLRIGTASYDLGAYDRVLVIGAGKATARMAWAAEAVLGDALSGGIIVVKHGHTVPLRRVEQVEASHPLPDEDGVCGTGRIIGLLKDADERTLILCLLSGGGSALLVAPADGIALSDKQRLTDLLLRAGASIDELNAVRKHLSAVKGGRLARLASPATVATLALSDVIGDRLDVIASGPTVADPSTYGQALAVLDRYGLREQAPPSARDLLERGARGVVPETPKEGDGCFRNARIDVIGSLALALEAARAAAEGLGYETRVLTKELQGDARAAARFLAAEAREACATVGAGPRCLLSGGETTVKVSGGGKGGRNQELALAFAIDIEGQDGVALLSAGTDGTDGPTDAAGAIVDGRTAKRAREARIDPLQFLDYNDSYTFFSRLDAAAGSASHLRTGPTGTNVMDVQIVLIRGNGHSGVLT